MLLDHSKRFHISSPLWFFFRKFQRGKKERERKEVKRVGKKGCLRIVRRWATKVKEEGMGNEKGGFGLKMKMD